jgi:KGK domain
VGLSPTLYSIIYPKDTIMLEHSYFSDFDDNDVVAFSEINLNKAKKLKEVMSNSLVSQLESTITSHSRNNSISYPDSVKLISEEGKTTHYNQWTKEGVHCEVLKLGAKEW